MINKFFRLFKKEYRTLNRIEITKNNLLSNFTYLSSINPNLKIAPVLKSNAYGHGILEVAKILAVSNLSNKIPFFCVDSLYEAYELLKAGINLPILIMGYTDPENFKIKKLPFSVAVFDIETAEVLNKYQPGSNIHIFVDTGMHREGVSLNDLSSFFKQLKQCKNLNVEGLMSHLSSADNLEDNLNQKQINNFKLAQKMVRRFGFNPKWNHLSNSDGLACHLSGGNVNMARIGLALYGISPNSNLKPVLSFKSKIIQIKKLRKGDRVGYSGTFTAKKSKLIGIIPLGYYDGVDRRLSNKGFINVADINCPIIGRVSMNITTIDLSQVNNPFVGQEVVVYSEKPEDKNSIQNTAKICLTIPYDILVHLATSTKRVTI